jgi:hypothetical protein
MHKVLKGDAEGFLFSAGSAECGKPRLWRNRDCSVKAAEDRRAPDGRRNDSEHWERTQVRGDIGENDLTDHL